MSLTPGWTAKPFGKPTPGFPIGGFDITHVPKDYRIGAEAGYYLNNGSEFKHFLDTDQGWADLCDELKEFVP